MKKIMFSFLAVAALASCVKEQTLTTLESATIDFAGTFVENATKADPSTTTANISEFSVWGVIDNETGIVLKDELVTKSGANWTYVNTQYWTPNHHYYFSAIAGNRDDIAIDFASADNNGMSVEGLGTMTFTNVEGTNDVLYAENNSIITPDIAALQDAPGKVKFQFKHLLSKVQFTFTNGFVNKYNTIVVKNIKMKVPHVGNVDLTADFTKKFSWTGHEDNTVLELGHVAEGARVAAEQSASSDNSRLTIPAGADYKYVVEFDVELYMGEVLASSAHKTVNISGYELVSGHSYNFKATINQDNVDENPLFPIEFEVEVDEWIEEDIDAGTIANTYVVNSAAELQAVLDANTENINILFGSDINGKVLVPENANRITRIDGQGHTFIGAFQINGKSNAKADDATTIFQRINFVADKNLLVGDAFIYCGELDGNTNVRYPDNITVEECTFTAANKDAVGVKVWSLYGDLSVKKCKANGLHSLLQLTSCEKANLVVDEVTISNSKNGISLDNTGKTTIKNSNISTDAYGIRANSDRTAANTNIVETEINALQPVIVRNVTVAGYVLNIDEASTLTTTENYHVIFTKNSDDKEYAAPAVDFTCNAPMKHKVFPKPEGWVRTAEDFVAAVTADKENISVLLINDVDVPISSLGQQTAGSGEYKLGGENTQNITIDLNGKALNITTTYWSALGAKNDDALFTIKNGSMTSTGNSAGTWNAWDLRFSNCNYAFENVDFGKAVALDNVGKSTSMKNVTITDNHNTDTYGLWITAEGQTVTLEDCVIDMTPAADGRGIKIDNQYIAAAEQKTVTLNVKNVIFKTDEKAAILVKSVAGAHVTLDNVDITEVDEDDFCHVWVDKDAAAYADKVVVNGGLCKVEGSVAAAPATAEELKDALTEDAKEISVYLDADLTYNVGAHNTGAMGGANTEVITIDLKGKTLTFNQTNSDWNNVITNAGKLVIKNGHITNAGKNDGPWNRHDINFNCAVELVNVTSDKALAFSSDATLTNVTIADANTSDTYAIWVRPLGQTVILDGCTINMMECTDGRGLKIDNQYLSAAEEAKVTLKVSDTKFMTEEKAAIVVKSTAGADIKLNDVDITGVKADKVNPVWVDSNAAAYFDLVSVYGGTKVQE